MPGRPRIAPDEICLSRSQSREETKIELIVRSDPRAAVHVDDGRQRSRSLGLMAASQPHLARLLLILDIPHVYFVFNFVDHAGNLQPPRVSL